MSDQAAAHDPMQVDGQSASQDAAMANMPELLNVSDSDNEDSTSDAGDVSVDDHAPAPVSSTPVQQITPADPVPNRRPRVLDVPDDDERARRTPTPHYTNTPPLATLPSGSARPIRPLPRVFTGGRIPLAGSYVHHGVSASSSSASIPGLSQSEPNTRPVTPQVAAHQRAGSQQPQPQPPPQAQAELPDEPPAWFSAIFRAMLAQANGNLEFFVGPDGVPRRRPAGPPPAANAQEDQQTDAPDFDEGAGPDEPQPNAVPPPFNFFNLFDAEPKDDPAQARRLIEGLEEIPQGLVKRYVRAETANGEGNGACAVCFESLDDDGEAAADWKAAAEAAEQQRAADVQTGSDQAATTAAENKDEPLRPRPLVLPCGHAFHSTCLEPWFAQHTSCPNCRFDVDPDRLTSTAYIEGRNQFPFGDGTGSPFGLLANLFAGMAATRSGARNAPQAENTPQENPILAELLNRARQGPPAAGPPVPSQHQTAESESPAQQQQPVHTGPFADLLARLNARPIRPLFQQQQQQQQQQQPEQQLQNQPMFGPPPPPGQGPSPSPGLGDSISIRFDITLQPIFADGAQPQSPQPTPPQQPQEPLIQPQPQPQPQPQLRSQQQQQLQQPPQQGDARRVSLDFLFGTLGPLGIGGNMPQTFQTPLGPGFAFGPFPAGGLAAQPRRPPSTPRKWSRPEVQGRTLRQRVEERERQLGLRCDSMSCDIAPTDEDPTPTVPAGVTMRTVKLQHPHGEPSGKHCEHVFHPQCLVTHARVTNANPDAVSCPLCRVEGIVDPADWQEGERVLQAELEQS